MIHATQHHDQLLTRKLASLSKKDKDYWSFKGNSKREHGHGLFQYPAMMVPQVVEVVLEQACAIHPEIEDVGDPFAGSGTILTESMHLGLGFSGTDINPLAVLLCKVKAGPFFIEAQEQKIEGILARIAEDKSNRIEVTFPNRDKWFRKDVAIALSRIRRAICHEPSLWARRFFWVGMAEAVRLSSNSRTTTYKLHVRTEQDRDHRECDPIALFRKAILRNHKHLANQAEHLNRRGKLFRGHYTQPVNIHLGNSQSHVARGLSDIVMTSPPYGDNATTVPYGQYSYLPLQWIELTDIDESIETDCLDTTNAIDSKSLGGSKKILASDVGRLRESSPALSKCLDQLKHQPTDRTSRVIAFFRDLDSCLDPVLSNLRPGGLMVWTLGNRKVGGRQVPLDAVLSDLLQGRQTRLLCQLSRQIHSKRMAPKNSIADTMSTESILVMRKAS